MARGAVGSAGPDTDLPETIPKGKWTRVPKAPSRTSMAWRLGGEPQWFPGGGVIGTIVGK